MTMNEDWESYYNDVLRDRIVDATEADQKERLRLAFMAGATGMLTAIPMSCLNHRGLVLVEPYIDEMQAHLESIRVKARDLQTALVELRAQQHVKRNAPTLCSHGFLSGIGCFICDVRKSPNAGTAQFRRKM